MNASASVLVVICVYNDWAAIPSLLSRLDTVLSSRQTLSGVLLVDDGSTDPIPSTLSRDFSSLAFVRILKLPYNLGHQRALALGLAHAYHQCPKTTVVMMDADGEDAPEDVPLLLDRLESTKKQRIVFAERTLRSEGWRFRFFYSVYRLLHRILTGASIRVGNFSAVPPDLLKPVLALPDLWNHYAAAIYRHQLPVETVPTRRGRRIGGASKMSFLSLVTHGLSALSVHGERIGVRCLLGSSVAMILFITLTASTGLGHLTAPSRVPLWLPGIAGLLCLVSLQCLLASGAYASLTLQNRSKANFSPLHEHAGFADRELKIK